MASRKADLLRPIYEEWGRGNWRPFFDVYAHVFKLRGDKVVRLETFATRAKAIESVSAALAERVS